jgi:hypothetical protein
VEWRQAADRRDRTPAHSPTTQHPTSVTPLERRALAAAVAAAAEEFGPLADSAEWMRRLPTWWRDSLSVAAFPVAVARALAPARTALPPVELSVAQLTPRTVPHAVRAGDAIDLHWWIWVAALLLFLIERAVAVRWRDPA